MKLLATTLVALVAARSRVGDSDIKLDAYGSIHREKIHLEELLQSWNNTMGTAPPRGWYRMRMEAVEGIDPNQIIKKSGLEGKTSVSFDFNLPDEHYCRYRKTETCCDREDQNCFTEAGCFCDEACFTTYGDCCQDHFVSCYDKLGLCLQDADDAPEAKNAASNEYKEVNKDAKKKREQKQMQNDVNGVSGTTPMFVEANACCGQHKYNDQIDCCVVVDGYKFIKRGEPCGEAVEGDGVDNRLQSPEPAKAAANAQPAQSQPSSDGFSFTNF